jgi:general secretion pathway protein C
MNALLIRLQKYPFYSLLPIVIFLSYSIAYIVRVGIIQLLPTDSLVTSPKSSQAKNNRAFSSNFSPKPVSLYEETVIGNMIRGAMAVPDSGDPAMAGAAPTITEEVQGAEEFLVTGTISGSPLFARMTAKEKDKEEAEEYGIGQKVVGYRVKEISQHHVVLFKNGINVRVEIGETIGEAKKRIIERAPEIVSSSPIDGNCPLLKKIVSKTDFERTLKNPADIYKDARFGPNLVDGKIDGYKIYQVPVTHIFYALGARNSDVIRRVNGMPLNDTEKMMELWSNIKNSNKIIIDIDRKGKCLTYEFTVRN